MAAASMLLIQLSDRPPAAPKRAPPHSPSGASRYVELIIVKE